MFSQMPTIVARLPVICLTTEVKPINRSTMIDGILAVIALPIEVSNVVAIVATPALAASLLLFVASVFGWRIPGRLEKFDRLNIRNYAIRE
jgi:hypothetical protein